MTPDGTWQIVHLTDLAKLKLGNSGLTTTPAGSGAPASANASPAANPGTLSSAGTADVNNAADAAKNGDVGSTGTTAPGTSTAGAATGTNNPNQGASGNNNPSNPTDGNVLGGGPMLGVVSKSKVEGIHSFGEKTKYSEWFFIYDPTQDVGKALLTGPYNPNMVMGAAANPGVGNNNGSPANHPAVERLAPLHPPRPLHPPQPLPRPLNKLWKPKTNPASMSGVLIFCGRVDLRAE